MQLSPSDPDIQTIVARIRNGDLDLQPDFQRGEVWSVQKKRRLIDSILRNWYVPPIHTVVVPGSHRQDVLDGQQRLAAIRDFVDNQFTVDGSIPPLDDQIGRLAGLHYRDLPPDARRLFDTFTIRVMRVTDYKPEEPGELFFRLNAITNVTAAEQRNAFYGPVRQQVKDVVSYFEGLDNSAATLGFSNSRMSYDDVLSKFLCTLESGSLAVKLTANVVSDRFRLDVPFSTKLIQLAEIAIDLFSNLRSEAPAVKFNKATLLSWLLFCSSYAMSGKREIIEENKHFLMQFEEQRIFTKVGIYSDENYAGIDGSTWRSLFEIFNDRSTSRVLDISSVILRDFVIHFVFYCMPHLDTDSSPHSADKDEILLTVLKTFSKSPGFQVERELEEILTPSVWGRLP